MNVGIYALGTLGFHRYYKGMAGIIRRFTRTQSSARVLLTACQERLIKHTTLNDKGRSRYADSLIKPPRDLTDRLKELLSRYADGLRTAPSITGALWLE